MCLAVLASPPTLPPSVGTRDSLGIPCWRGLATVYACGSKVLDIPRVAGTIKVYAPDFAAVEGKVKSACRLVRHNERSRSKRSLVCGEANISMRSDTPRHECTGTFYIDIEDDAPAYKRLV